MAFDIIYIIKTKNYQIVKVEYIISKKKKE